MLLIGSSLFGPEGDYAFTTNRHVVGTPRMPLLRVKLPEPETSQTPSGCPSGCGNSSHKILWPCHSPEAQGCYFILPYLSTINTEDCGLLNIEAILQLLVDGMPILGQAVLSVSRV